MKLLGVLVAMAVILVGIPIWSMTATWRADHLPSAFSSRAEKVSASIERETEELQKAIQGLHVGSRE